MYIVRFIRRDGQPHEDYYYTNSADAIGHMKLFANDDSGLYKRIELICVEDHEIVITALEFQEKKKCE